MMASLPEYFAHQRAKESDPYEVAALEVIMLGSVNSAMRALDRLSTRHKLTVISNDR